MLLQMLTTHNLTSFILFFYVGVLVLCLLPFEVLLCDKQFKNALVDTILLAFIFLVSAFCYIQAWKAKVKSLTQQIYSLLIKLQASLEAKIALINANDLAYNNSIAVKTAIIVLLLTSIALFAYWWLGGGGDDSGGGGGTPTEPSASQGSSKYSSNDSLNLLLDLEPPVDTTALNYSGLDKAVFDVIKSSVVGTTIFPNNSLHFPEGKKILKDLFFSEENLSSLLNDKRLWDLITSENVNVDALNLLTDALSELQASFENGTSIPDDLESSNRTQLAELATNLAKLLPEPEDLSNILSEQECPLLCSALLLYIFTYGTELLSILEEMVNLLLKRANSYLENCPTEKFNALDKALDKCNEVYGPLKDIFDSWAEKRVGDSSAYNFIKRFQGLFKNPA